MKKIKHLGIFFLSIMLIQIGCTIDETPKEDKQLAEDTTTTVVQDGKEFSVSSDQEGIDLITAIIIIVIVVVVVGFSFFFFKNVFPVGLWFKAWTAGVRVGLRAFLNMYFQKIPPDLIVSNMIKARKAGVVFKVKKLEDLYLAHIDVEKIVQAHIEAHNADVKVAVDELGKAYLAKVNIEKLVEALILVKNADIDTDLQELTQMYLTGVDIVEVVKAKIEAKNSGYPIKFSLLGEHYLAGGNLEKTIDAYVAARKANLKDFDFKDIAEIDLAGYDVYSVIEKAIIPRVVEGDTVRGVARDGVELSMKLKVTLRAKLEYIIGNPEEGTILARINENLASEIGLAENHYHVLESPFELAEKVEAKNLDENTAFEVLSIDVSDVAIGKDVHAVLRTERARADAEKAKSDVIRAEEKLKKSIAGAFMDGKITVEEYEKLMNMQADTKMRNSLSSDLDKKNIDDEDDEDDNKHNDNENDENNEHKDD